MRFEECCGYSKRKITWRTKVNFGLIPLGTICLHAFSFTTFQK